MNESPSIKKFNLRVPVDLMEQAQEQAESMGISLNAYCMLALRNYTSYTSRGRPQPAKPARAVLQQRDPTTVRDAAKRAEPNPLFRKVGRNERCPCGSGEKAKSCHPAWC